MSIYARINVGLSIAGPFICAETGPISWGVDKAFSRDFNSEYYIDRSHIKGKLREALEELSSPIGLAFWFGKDDSRDADGNATALDGDVGRLLFSNFYPQKTGTKAGTITRVRINDRGTAEEKMLFVVEDPFPALGETSWEGSIEYFCSNRNEAEKIYLAIRAGFKWITAFGAMKGMGMGSLRSVHTRLKTEDIIIPKPSSSPASGSSTFWLGLRIDPEEPFLVLGPKKKENYSDSDVIIRGNMIKGALAEALNRRLNPKGKLNAVINKQNDNVAREFPLICEYFEKIIVAHAFPTLSHDTRPVAIPDSTVMVTNNYYDIALYAAQSKSAQDNTPLTKRLDFCISNVIPRFKTGWKSNELAAEFGWAKPKKIHKTRTAIEGTTRIAATGQLFTFQYTCPVDSKRSKIHWLSNINLSNIPEKERGQLANELKAAFPLLDRLGKRKSRVTVKVDPHRWKPAKESAKPKDSAIDILVLQSDALMINPQEIAEKDCDLFYKYNQYFMDISNDRVALIDFFATEKLLGGFLARNLRRYYPYFLTEAGSVFVLRRAKSQPDGKERTLEWLDKGLPLPKWLESSNLIPRNLPLWKVCPFLPENGFGEVAVNLAWHWSKGVAKNNKTDS